MLYSYLFIFRLDFITTCALTKPGMILDSGCHKTFVALVNFLIQATKHARISMRNEPAFLQTTQEF